MVLSEDPLTMPEERLPGIVADLTVADGRVVNERARGGKASRAPASAPYRSPHR